MVLQDHTAQAIGWVRVNFFQVDVSFIILHIIHTTLKESIGFIEIEYPSIISPILYVWDRHPIRELISTVQTFVRGVTNPLKIMH